MGRRPKDWAEQQERKKLDLFTVTDQEMIEYTKCTLRHLYAYGYKVPTIQSDRLNIQLHSLRDSLLWFYGEIASGNEITLDAIFQTFGKFLCEKVKNAKLDIDTFGDLIATGRTKLKRHYDDLEHRGTSYIAVNVPYERVFRRSDAEVTIQGTLDLVRARHDWSASKRSIEVVQFMLNRELPGNIERANCIDMTLARLGIETYGNFTKRRTNSAPKVFWHSIHQDVELEIPTDPHALRVAHAWVANLGFAIGNKVYYPQYEWNRCMQCPFKSGCDPDYFPEETKKAPETIKREVERRLTYLSILERNAASKKAKE